MRFKTERHRTQRTVETHHTQPFNRYARSWRRRRKILKILMCDSMHVREVHFNKVVNRNVLPQNISSQQREADKKVINICVTFEFETPAAVGYTYR